MTIWDNFNLRSKKLSIIVIILLFFIAEASPYELDTLKINQGIGELIVQYQIPGVALAIIGRDSSWIETYGYSDNEKKDIVSNKTIFRVGSISKSYLAIAVRQLVDDGLIELNDRVSDIIPEVEFNNRWEVQYPVRIIHLLEHTSSIDDVHFNEGYYGDDEQIPSLSNVFSKNPKSRYVRWKPGEFTSYSNDAYSLLALVIEKVTDKPFEEYIQQNILDLIGITSTTYIRNEINESLFAQGYTSSGNSLEYAPVLMRPSGGINTNIEDLAKFVQMLLNHGYYNNTSVIDSITLSEMLFPTSSLPAKEGFKLGFGSGFSSHFVNGHKFHGHGGGLPDFKSIFLFNLELDLGIIILVNSNTDYFRHLISKVVSILNIEPDIKDKIVKNSKNQFNVKDVTGYYSQANYGISLDRFPNYFLSGQTVSIVNDTLYIQGFQSNKDILTHLQGNAYLINNNSLEQVYFFKNSDGKIMLTINGKEFYIEDVSWKAMFCRYFLLFCLVNIMLFVLFTILWVTKRIIYFLNKKDIKKYQLSLRLFPLFSIIALFICLISLSLWFSDYNNAGNITTTSMLVFISSILFPIFSVISFWNCCFNKKMKLKNKYEKLFIIVVSSTLLGLSLFLFHFEIVGLRLWAY